jgi:hypothetical protein
MDPIPIYDDTVDVTCTATSAEIPVRIEQLERIRNELRGIERAPHGLLLHFADDPDLDAELRRFAVEEKGCCRFWGFAVEASNGDLTLRWDGPPTVDDFIDRLFDWFQGDEPLAVDSGLL